MMTDISDTLPPYVSRRQTTLARTPRRAYAGSAATPRFHCRRTRSEPPVLLLRHVRNSEAPKAVTQINSAATSYREPRHDTKATLPQKSSCRYSCA